MARAKNVLLDGEINPDAYTDEDAPVVTKVSTAVLEPPAPPPAPAQAAANPDLMTLVAALTQALQGGMTQAIESTKDKPRSREDHEYERVSVYNPLGDRDHPRAPLKCEFFWGVSSEEDPSQPPVPLYPILAQQLAADEIEALNGLAPGRSLIEMHDGKKESLAIHGKQDAVTGTLSRLVLGLPKKWYEKNLRNMVPNVRQIARQVREGAHVA
jgi:hypothetical protein